MPEELTIGTLAERTGVSVSFLRFYENAGLLRPRRTAGNQRRYPPDAVAVVDFIQNARRGGLPISLIAKALHVPGTEMEEFSHEDFCGELGARMQALRNVRHDVEEIATMCDRQSSEGTCGRRTTDN